MICFSVFRQDGELNFHSLVAAVMDRPSWQTIQKAYPQNIFLVNELKGKIFPQLKLTSQVQSDHKVEKF